MSTRFRIRHSFWLEVDKPDHALVNDTIGQLKAERSFATVIRDGVMLVSRLRAGDIDLLLHLFPFVEQAILERHKSGNSGPGGGDIDKLQQQIDVLRQLIYAIPSNEKKPDVAATPQEGRGPKALQVPTTPAPLSVPAMPGPAADDSDGLVVTKAKSDGKNTAANNFLNSAFSLIQ